ncbi:MAG: hypothetical protein JWN77_2386 [Frankiales bacterium]|jgi:hypothetical protein|nr:hypothetical protein [Frankiales bacterium]
MRLEGTLDAFSLPDIFQLLSFTKKTGTLHLRRVSDSEGDAHGAVHLRDGAITGARSDVRRQALGRRIVGAGLVDDDALAAAVARVRAESCGLARALADADPAVADTGRDLAVEQATDAVFDLLRWADGEFAFVVDEPDPDDLGASLPVEDVVTEARRRIESWSVSPVPAPDAVVSLVTTPADEPVLTRDEWALLALVDGRRTVADFVALSGRGEYAIVCALGALVQRGLLSFGESGDDLARRQELLGELEGVPAPAARPSPAPRKAAEPVRAPVIPERPEPFTPPRQPEHAETAPVYVRASAPAPRPPVTVSAASSVGEVHGATAMQPAPEQAVAPAASPYIERDPSVNKSLLLRLIAGVRGL